MEFQGGVGCVSEDESEEAGRGQITKPVLQIYELKHGKYSY